jgi:putative oxidoreductase
MQRDARPFSYPHSTNHQKDCRMFLFLAPSPSQVNLALLILRLTVGTVFIAHGAQKLFSFGIGGIAGGFTQMGVPLPGVMAPLISILEFFGGIALVLGLLTRLAALGLVCDMLGAIIVVHGKEGFFLPKGYEFVLLLLGASLALVVAGAGRYSVDDAIDTRLSNPAISRGGKTGVR